MKQIHLIKNKTLFSRSVTKQQIKNIIYFLLVLTGSQFVFSRTPKNNMVRDFQVQL